MSKTPYLRDVLPTLAKIIEEKLFEEGLNTLAESVNQLQIERLCKCNEPNCGSFYTSEMNLEEEMPVQGFVLRTGEIIQVMDDRIAFIEIFPSGYGAKISDLIKRSFSETENG